MESDTRVYRLSAIGPIFFSVALIILTAVAVATGVFILIAGCVLLTALLPIVCIIGLNNRRLEVNGTQLSDYDWKGRLRLQVDLADVRSIDYDSETGAPTHLVWEAGRISINSLKGYKELLRYVAKGRPDLRLSPDKPWKTGQLRL